MGLALVLRGRARTIALAVIGVLLGVVVIAKVLDMGFYLQLDRPFNPVFDRGTFGPAYGVVRDSVGTFWAVLAVIAALAMVVGFLALVPLALLRVGAVAARHRSTSARTAGALGIMWLVAAMLGAPLAADGTSRLVYADARAIHSALLDEGRFAKQLSARDGYAAVPSSRLLSGLRGKDVLIVFVESYGQSAVQGSSFSPGVDATLTAGTAQLAASGFQARSGFLTSPTFGGISWLAHSTLQSGLWIDNQQRYDQLVASRRLTLTSAFSRAGWRTVSDIPSDTADWPDGRTFYHYDRLYDGKNVGYRGPKFSYAAMPDEYTLATFARKELQPQHAPVMAEIDLVSSHEPWAPLPQLVPWDQIGDGSIYRGMPQRGQQAHAVWHSVGKVQAAYGQSIQYSMQSLVTFVQNAHDKNLVVIALGDHQPYTVVSGWTPTHNVPVSIIAADPGVFDRIASWHWQPGLMPAPDAPLWRMDAFRNRFLNAFDH